MLTQPITIVDARMGRGKSSAAIRYMNEAGGGKRFLYVTPYLKEVDRVCERCDFEQPNDTFTSKSNVLKHFLRAGRSVAATHSLFYLLDEEALNIILDKKYTLIVDESVETVSKVPVSSKDLKVIIERFATLGEDGKLRWIDPEYEGKFSVYKEIADAGNLCLVENNLLDVLDPAMFRCFEEVFMMTYLFDGQPLKAYLDYFRLPYRVVGIDASDDGYRFSDGPDAPPPTNYRELIHIVYSDRMNRIGDAPTALSKSWYERRSADSEDLKVLRNNLRNFFEHYGDTASKSGERLWTCFTDDRPKISGKRNLYSGSWLQVNARATNEYRGRTRVAYLVNRFANPGLRMFFAKHGCDIDDDAFALSEMLQWIWRSAIRDGRPIDLYIPSARMRGLLEGWMDQMIAVGTPDSMRGGAAS